MKKGAQGNLSTGFPLMVVFVAIAFFVGSAAAQGQELQQKVAEVKQASAQNKQALAQYTWTETATVSLKGEQKKQEHFQVHLGPDGKPQKSSLDAPPSAEDNSGGRRQGRLKEHIVEKKKEEYKNCCSKLSSKAISRWGHRQTYLDNIACSFRTTSKRVTT